MLTYDQGREMLESAGYAPISDTVESGEKRLTVYWHTYGRCAILQQTDRGGDRVYLPVDQADALRMFLTGERVMEFIDCPEG